MAKTQSWPIPRVELIDSEVNELDIEEMQKLVRICPKKVFAIDEQRNQLTVNRQGIDCTRRLCQKDVAKEPGKIKIFDVENEFQSPSRYAKRHTLVAFNRTSVSASLHTCSLYLESIAQ